MPYTGPQTSIGYREQLVKNIEAALGRSLSLPIQDAFIAIAREAFVDQYYRQRGNKLVWDTILEPTLEEIYQDYPLVTKLDDRMMPCSSSSQPSIMAAQLEALALATDQRVLEIGTGTGYNAALMAYLVRQNGVVVSVDIDEDLVQQAMGRLQKAGLTNVFALTADGYQGYARYAPYDRLLATCGVSHIPPFWLHQLREGGILIANVHLPLASVFMRIKKAGKGGTGYLLPLQASYMRLIGSHDISSSTRRVDWKQLSTLSGQQIRLDEDLETLLENSNGFIMLLQSFCPNLTKKYRYSPSEGEKTFALYLISQPNQGAIAHIHKDQLTLYGQAETLKEQIQTCIQTYRDLGRPRIEDYGLSIHETDMTITVNSQEFPLFQNMK